MAPLSSHDEQEKDINSSPQDFTSSAPAISRRPSISYASPGLFLKSVYRRFLSLWTRSFTIALACGQLLSLCITCASVLTTELVDRGWVLPNTQVFCAYTLCCCLFTPYTIYQYGLRGWYQLVLRQGWKYFLLALCGFEASFLYVKAYGFTDLLSCMLLDAWSIPVCLFTSWLLMRTKYHWTQIIGVLVSVAGLGMLVASDFLTGKDGHPTRRAEGDGFMLAAATLYGIANATEEVFARNAPLYEVIGQMGLWGMIASGIQAAVIEHKNMASAQWNPTTVGLLIGNAIFASTTYMLSPYLFRVASSAYFNISLLTSDFYGLIFGLFLFHYSPYWLYFPAFVVVILGLVIYFWHSTPEEQGPLNVNTPQFVRAIQRSRQPTKE